MQSGWNGLKQRLAFLGKKHLATLKFTGGE